KGYEADTSASGLLTAAAARQQVSTASGSSVAKKMEICEEDLGQAGKPAPRGVGQTFLSAGDGRLESLPHGMRSALRVALAEELEQAGSLLGGEWLQLLARPRRRTVPRPARHHQRHARSLEGPNVVPGVRVGHLIAELARGDDEGGDGRGHLPLAV